MMKQLHVASAVNVSFGFGSLDTIQDAGTMKAELIARGRSLVVITITPGRSNYSDIQQSDSKTRQYIRCRR